MVGGFVMALCCWLWVLSCLCKVALGSVFDEVGEVAVFLDGFDFEGLFEFGLHANGEVLAGGFGWVSPS